MSIPFTAQLKIRSMVWAAMTFADPRLIELAMAETVCSVAVDLGPTDPDEQRPEIVQQYVDYAAGILEDVCARHRWLQEELAHPAASFHYTLAILALGDTNDIEYGDAMWRIAGYLLRRARSEWAIEMKDLVALVKLDEDEVLARVVALFQRTWTRYEHPPS